MFTNCKKNGLHSKAIWATFLPCSKAVDNLNGDLKNRHLTKDQVKLEKINILKSWQS